MHPSPQPDPHQPGYGQPGPRQPDHGQPGYGRPPVGYGLPSQVPPPPPPLSQTNPDAMPGAAVAVRVLMFIGGPVGILLGVFIGIVALFGFGVGQMMGELSQDAEGESAFGFLSALAGFVALVPLVYGIVSTTLAALMGRRKPGLFWGVIVFHSVAVLILLIGVVLGDYLSLIPMAFAALMLGLMFTPGVRAFYRL